MNANAIALDALKDLYRGYVNTLENGRDRILSLGGQCDPLDKMEASDPWLISARAAIAALEAEPQPEQTASISLGPVAFEFAHFQQWVNKASTWFGALREANSNAAQRRYLCIDAAGRVCMIGRDFSRARDEGKFPVRVHLIDALPATTPKD